MASAKYRPLTAAMREYLQDLLVGADLSRWSAPRWEPMRRSLADRQLIERPAKKGGRTQLTPDGKLVAEGLGRRLA
jgi:hypothetical protein